MGPSKVYLSRKEEDEILKTMNKDAIDERRKNCILCECTTGELMEELKRRRGVNWIDVPNEEKVTIGVDGFATVLIVID